MFNFHMPTSDFCTQLTNTFQATTPWHYQQSQRFNLCMVSAMFIHKTVFICSCKKFLQTSHHAHLFSQQ